MLDVAIPIKSAESCLKSKGIATPVCALARNDVEIWQLFAFVRLPDKFQFSNPGRGENGIDNHRKMC